MSQLGPGVEGQPVARSGHRLSGGARWGLGPALLTEYRELGGAGAHGARLVPRLAVVEARLVHAQPAKLQVGSGPVLSPVQQGPVVEPGWRVDGTMGILVCMGRGGGGEGWACSWGEPGSGA
jgi:hypothetical protein